MRLKIKEEYLDINISSPFTGKQIWLRELNPLEYIHWYNKHHQYLFEVIENKVKK